MSSNSSWVDGTSNGSTKAKLHYKTTQRNTTNILILSHLWVETWLIGTLVCSYLYSAAFFLYRSFWSFALRSQNSAFQVSWNRCGKTLILAPNNCDYSRVFWIPISKHWPTRTNRWQKDDKQQQQQQPNKRAWSLRDQQQHHQEAKQQSRCVVVSLCGAGTPQQNEEQNGATKLWQDV